MSKLWVLFKTLYKANSGFSGNEEDGVVVSNTTIAMYLIEFAGVIGLGYVGYKYDLLIALLGGQWMLFKVLGMLAAVCSILVSFIAILNAMYLSSDIDLIIVLPFSAEEIAVTRLLSCALPAFEITAVLMLPLNIGYCLTGGVYFEIWLAIILSLILIPVFSLCVTAVLMILLMSFVSVLNSRETLKYIGAVAGFGLMAAYYARNPAGTEVNAQQIIGQTAEVSGKINYAFPPVHFLSQYMETEAFSNVLIAVGSVLAAAALFYFVAKKFYLTSAMKMKDSGSSAGSITNDKLQKECTQKSVKKALFMKDFNEVKRSPAFLMKVFLVPYSWPLFFLILFRTLIPVMKIGLEMLEQQMEEYPFMGLVFTLIIACTLISVTAYALVSSPLAYSSVSREGNDFMIMKQIPVSYEDQLKAKRDLAVWHALSCTTVSSVIIVLLLVIFFKVPAVPALIGIVVQVLTALLIANLDFYEGLKRINVEWDDEKNLQKKGGLCPIVGFGLMILAPAGCIAASIALFFDGVTLSTANMISAGLFAAMAAAAVYSHIKVIPFGVKKLEEL